MPKSRASTEQTPADDALRPDVLVIGEALVDIIHAHGPPERILPGGSPLNVAVGLARLECSVHLHTDVGADAYGDIIEDFLAGNGVTVTGIGAKAPTSVAQARVGPDGSASYAFRVRWDPPPLGAQVRPSLAVHVGSIGALMDPGARLVEEAVASRRATATVSFDPNIRPLLLDDHAAALERVGRLVSRADIVKASDEDLAWLRPGADPAQVARDWLDLGPSLVALTRGADGALVLVRAGTVAIPALVTEVVDTVGAGDSFMAGLLAALAHRRLLGRPRAGELRDIDTATTSEVAEFAARCAAVTVSRPGADLPRSNEVTDAAARRWRSEQGDQES